MTEKNRRQKETYRERRARLRDAHQRASKLKLASAYQMEYGFSTSLPRNVSAVLSRKDRKIDQKAFCEGQEFLCSMEFF